MLQVLLREREVAESRLRLANLDRERERWLNSLYHLNYMDGYSDCTLNINQHQVSIGTYTYKYMAPIHFDVSVICPYSTAAFFYGHEWAALHHSK